MTTGVPGVEEGLEVGVFWRSGCPCGGRSERCHVGLGQPELAQPREETRRPSVQPGQPLFDVVHAETGSRRRATASLSSQDRDVCALGAIAQGGVVDQHAGSSIGQPAPLELFPAYDLAAFLDVPPEPRHGVAARDGDRHQPGENEERLHASA